jgi:hypothetical protein
MSKTFSTKLAGVGLLLLGACLGVAGAQVGQAVSDPHYINIGPFSVATGEDVNFRVGLDERPGGAPARVQLQLINADGGVVAQNDLVLQPGQSTTLQHTNRPGVYRANVRVINPAGDLGLRHTVVSAVEVSDQITARIRPVCGHDDSAGSARPQ